MKVTIELEQEDFDTISDVVFGVFGKVPSKPSMLAVWHVIPENIKGSALQWGLDDLVPNDLTPNGLATLELVIQLADDKGWLVD